MGKRGPAPKPTKLRVLHGDKKSRINHEEPVPPEAPVTCPSWLSAKAKAVWRRLAPSLIARGVLTPWDADMFARFCVLEVLNRQALEDVEKRGTLVAGRHKGEKVKNPSVQIARDTGAQLLAIAGRFGLTPSDRSQVKPAKGQGSGASRLLS